MFNIFKKSKPKQKIIWDYIPIRPSTKAFNFEGGKDLKDYLVPTREILPKSVSYTHLTLPTNREV